MRTSDLVCVNGVIMTLLWHSMMHVYLAGPGFGLDRLNMLCFKMAGLCVYTIETSLFCQFFKIFCYIMV